MQYKCSITITTPSGDSTTTENHSEFIHESKEDAIDEILKLKEEYGMAANNIFHLDGSITVDMQYIAYGKKCGIRGRYVPIMPDAPLPEPEKPVISERDEAIWEAGFARGCFEQEWPVSGAQIPFSKTDFFKQVKLP